MHLEENKKHCITFSKIFYLNWHSFLWLVFDPLKIHVLYFYGISFSFVATSNMRKGFEI